MPELGEGRAQWGAGDLKQSLKRAVEFEDQKDRARNR
jgi:hypothetical protein